MSTPQEHDYIGLTETSSMERSSETKLSSSSSSSTLDNLKETELRLGLPGSDSHSESKKPAGVSLFGMDLEEKHINGFSVVAPLKNLVSGSKRGFADANIDGSSGKWVFSVSSDQVDLGKKGAALFTPRGLECNGNSTQKPGPAMKDGVGGVPQSAKPVQDNNKELVSADHGGGASAAKAQVVGWPPIRSFRKNTMASNSAKNGDDSESKTAPGCLYVKVSMDGAPYLRKVDLKIYSNYVELSSALEKMFSCFTIGQCSSHGLPGRDGLSESRLMDLLHGSEYVLTYEDKDHDWMLVGDVPWDMFTDSCKRLRIMKGSEAIGLAPRAMEKCKNRN